MCSHTSYGLTRFDIHTLSQCLICVSLHCYCLVCILALYLSHGHTITTVVYLFLGGQAAAAAESYSAVMSRLKHDKPPVLWPL